MVSHKDIGMAGISRLFALLGLLLIFSFGCLGEEVKAPTDNGTVTTNISQNMSGPAAPDITEPQDGKPSIEGWKPVTGNWTLKKVPDPLSGDNSPHLLVPRNMPAAGESFDDLQFGTRVGRVTETPGIRHEYSRFDPFNADKSRVILHVPATGEWRVYKTQDIPYDKTGNLVRSVDLEDPRWDPVDKGILWGLRDLGIIRINVVDGTETTAKDFSQDPKIGPIIQAEPDLYRITMFNEGETSLDKRYWAFILQGSQEDYRPRYLFTWDMLQDKVLGIYNISDEESSIDWVGMSALGNYVLIGADGDNGGKLAGLVIADKELKKFHKINYDTAHSDVGLDSLGKEVIVMQNSRTDHIDIIPIEWNTTSIEEAGGSYAGTGHIPLIRLFYASESQYSLDSGVHISCNSPGYCVISTYIEPGLEEQNWLDRSIVLARLDRVNPEVFYLAKVYGTTGDYWEETQATITNDGRRVLWATNWNQGVGSEEGKSVFLMQLDLN